MNTNNVTTLTIDVGLQSVSLYVDTEAKTITAQLNCECTMLELTAAITAAKAKLVDCDAYTELISPASQFHTITYPYDQQSPDDTMRPACTFKYCTGSHT